MSSSFSSSSRAWLLVLLVALGFVAWVNFRRNERVIYATQLVAEPLAADANSPTGLAGGARQLIVPGHNNDSYHWIVQTQQMFARGEARVRHVDYDNAPFGRSVDAPSPYRWWIGLLAAIDHHITGRPIGWSVERLAQLADPLLHVALLLGATAFVAWQFGSFPAALVAVSLAMVFPFAGSYVPGAPDDRGLVLVSAIASVLPLLAGLQRRIALDPAQASRRLERWFLVGGIAGGLALWVSVPGQVPVLGGIFLGGLLGLGATRRERTAESGPVITAAAWAAWALGGTATGLIAYLVEYFPDHLGVWQLRTLHPLYGLAWLGLGGLLVLLSGRTGQARGGVRWRRIVGVIVPFAAVAVVPIVMWKTKGEGFLAADIAAFQLTKLDEGAPATSVWAWMLRDGITPKLWISVLPVLLLLPAGWVIVRRTFPAEVRAGAALTGGPVLVALGFAGRQLSWWNTFDALSIVLLVATVAATVHGPYARRRRLLWAMGVVVICALGGFQLRPRGAVDGKITLGESELIGLIERDLARWLAKHAGGPGAVVLASPNETMTLHYYGGLRGLGTLAWENVDGIGAAVRILSASTPEEAKELIDRREVAYLVIPTWDLYLEEYARIGMGQLEGTFLSRIQAWRLPPWLRPVAYQLPTIAGFEGQAVKVFKVVEDQDDAAALSRIAEYFVEMGQLDLAASVGVALRRFPADLGALAARGQVELARGDSGALDKTIESLRSRLAASSDRALLWDRRVSLAILLARAKLMDLARVQVQKAYAAADEDKLRALDPGALYRLQILGKAFSISFPTEQTKELAHELVPEDLRSRL